MTILRQDDNDELRDHIRERKSGFGRVLVGAVTGDDVNSRKSRNECSVGDGVGLGVVDNLFLRRLEILCAFYLGAGSGRWEYLRVQVAQRRKKFRNFWDLPKPPFLFVFLYGACTEATASPITEKESFQAGKELHWLFPRETSTSTLIPAVAICGFLFVLIVVTFWRRRDAILSRLRNRMPSRLTGSGAAPTELTAEQLAGTINHTGGGNQNTTSANGTSGGNTTAATRTRRTRRPRRTPSQISTHSLPAYAKEPGEQELVIFQGRQDMEDAPIPQPLATVVDLGDDAEDSMDGHPRLRYTPIPETPTDAPLLQDDPAHSPDSPSMDFHRRSGSIATGTGSADTTSLARAESDDPEAVADTRGDAPPYFEVVGQTGSDSDHIPRRSPADAGPHNAPMSLITPTDTAPSPPSPQRDPPQRRSGFRSLLDRMSVAGTPSHARNDSSASANSSFNSHTRGPSGTSILGFRTISRQKSITSHNSSRINLTSPSMISLTSISAPLTHTALRTEFTYPRSGPTPEQMKLIASRDSLVRFGVPYGPDAVAFASLSRVDLANGERPPDFEVAVEGSSLRNGDEATAAASPSPRASGEGNQTQDESAVNHTALNPDLDRAPRPTSLDGLPVERNSGTADVEGIPTVTQASAINDLQSAKEITGGDAKAEVAGGLGVKEAFQEEGNLPVINLGHGNTSFVHKDLVTVEGPVSINTPASLNPHASTSAQPTPSTPISTATSAPSDGPVPTMSSPPSITAPEQATKQMSSPPPSSYHPPAASELRPHDDASLQRSESRASQFSYASYTSYTSDMTYRTAAESLSSRRMIGNATPSVGDESDEDEEGNFDAEGTDERPLTPTLGGRVDVRHGRESTDATITGPTPMTSSRATRAKQERHMSIATITQA